MKLTWNKTKQYKTAHTQEIHISSFSFDYLLSWSEIIPMLSNINNAQNLIFLNKAPQRHYKEACPPDFHFWQNHDCKFIHSFVILLTNLKKDSAKQLLSQ